MKRSLRDIAAKGTHASSVISESAEVSNDTSSVDSLISQYSGMSESELMCELSAAVSKQKAEGKFDPESLQRGIEAIAPMLNEEQRRRLYNITGRL